MRGIVARMSGIAGMGVYATRTFKKGEIVLQMKGKRLSSDAFDILCAQGFRNDDPFQVSDTDYVLLNTLPNFINHSCNPNCGIRGAQELVTLRAIKSGEELSYDYSTTVGSDGPDESPWVMRCKCKARNCRTRIGNWETLPRARLAYYKRVHALPDYILGQMKRQYKTKTAP